MVTPSRGRPGSGCDELRHQWLQLRPDDSQRRYYLQRRRDGNRHRCHDHATDDHEPERLGGGKFVGDGHGQWAEQHNGASRHRSTGGYQASTANLASNATTLIIQGFGFSSAAANNTVTFSGGATGTVTGAASTTLTVTGLSGLAVGALTATVTSNSVSSASAVQVATVTPPNIIFASGFANPEGVAVDAAGNLYVVNEGAGTVSEVTPAGAVSTFASGFTQPLGLAFDAAGNLYVADVGANTVSKVAPTTLNVGTPVVIANSANLAANATTLIIHGTGFSTTAASDKVTFSGGATGTVTGATTTQLTVTNLHGLVLGNLSATVVVGGGAA